jgi:hypothetical protein
MKKAVRVALALAATLMLACGNRPEPTGYGNAHLEVIAPNLSLADVAQVRVTVSGPHISPDIVQTLTGYPASGWSGVEQEHSMKTASNSRMPDAVTRRNP